MRGDQLASPLLIWFNRHGRKDLPWQHNPTPYRVWISEVMLQQTRVGVVIPYFDRFLARFPTLKDLAEADQAEVLRLWSGLGYYARARNLHQAARKIVSDHRGLFPTSIKTLEALPGIGRSTAGAILSLALGQRHAILDGNVKRVLARYFSVPGWPGRSSVAKRLWELAEACTPAIRVQAYNQAIMDLGATVCLRTGPNCRLCPLAQGCAALARGEPTAFPEPKPCRALPAREVQVLVLRNHNGEVLLERRPPTGIWGGLWSLPECQREQEATLWCESRLGVLPGRVEKLPARRHSFSHFRLIIKPLAIVLRSEAAPIAESGQTLWCDPTRPIPVAVAAPIAKILHEIGGRNQTNLGAKQ